MIVIIGGGIVGQALKAHWGQSAVFLEGEHSTMGAFRERLKALSPTVVVNAALRGTPASLEAIEAGSEEFNEHLIPNVLLPEWLGLLASEQNFTLIHISTLMLLGEGGRVESSPLVEPDSRYVAMKIQAEARLQAGPTTVVDPARVLIPRIHLPFTTLDHPRNFFVRMRGFDTFVSDASSMTALDEFGGALDALLAQGVRGVVHCANPGTISFSEVARRMQVRGLIPGDRELKTTNLAELNAKGQGAYQPLIVASSEKVDLNAIGFSEVSAAVDRCLAALAL